MKTKFKNLSFKKDHFNFFQKLKFKLFKKWMSDETFANLSMARWLNGGDVRKPKTFTEKLHWLNIYYKKEILRDLADKYLVRNYVKYHIGNKYLNSLYSVYRNSEEIDFSDLPNSFVIKCSHGSGMNIFVEDKNKISIPDTKKQLNKWLKEDRSKPGREWFYSGRPRRIIIEKLLLNNQNQIPEDIKIFCFNGKPKMIQVDLNRFSRHTRAMFDINWNRLPVEYLYMAPKEDIPKPKDLDKILYLAKCLSKNLPFVRTDFYSLPRVFFGEMTFFPGAGTEPFRPSKWDLKIGEWFDLPKNLD